MPARVESLERDVEIIIDQLLSPEAQSAAFAKFAREVLAEAEETDLGVLGRVPTHETIVDGRIGAIEESVKPDGVIVYVFDLVEDVFAFIAAELETHSPVGTGKDPHSGLYRRSHIFYADGVEADPLKPPPNVMVGTFVNAVPYARKIEHGESPQFPDGVYETVAAAADRRFGNIARVHFDYRAVAGGSVLAGAAGNKSAGRNPAVVVMVR